MKLRTCAIGLVLLIATTSVAQQTIYWKKDHVYAGANGPEIAIITPPTTDTTPPSAPTITSAPFNYTSVTLYWTGSTDTGGSGLAGYKIYRRIGSGAALPVGTVGTSTFQFTDQPLKSNITYTYTIVAFDKAQNHSSASNPYDIITSSDTTPPSVPAGMAVAYVSSTSVRVTWTASSDSGSGLATYRVYRDGTAISGALPATTRTYLDSTLAANAAYTYTVKATDNVGNESAGISRSVFRDDFNRSAGTGLNSGYWAASGSWVINSNQAYMAANSTGYDALSTKSFTSFSASATVLSGYPSGAGIVFWSDDGGTERYAVKFNVGNNTLSLLYLTSSQTFTLAQSTIVQFDPFILSVSADSSSRAIAVLMNGLQKISYTETNTGRRNTGRVGIRGDSSPYTGYARKVDDFIVVENGGSLTATDIVPANLRLTFTSPTAILVQWDAAADWGAGIAGYEVYRNGSLVSGGSPISGTSFQDSGLTANAVYTYTVKSVDGNGVRYATATKTGFRDNFDHAPPITSNTGWSSAGGWTISGNTARLSTYPSSWTPVWTSSSFGNVRVSADVGGPEPVDLLFWYSGSDFYSVTFGDSDVSIRYNTAAGATLLSSTGGNYRGSVRVEANAQTKSINVFVGTTLILSFVDTASGHNSSGKTGFGGTIRANAECEYYGDCSGLYITADNFMAEEQ